MGTNNSGVAGVGAVVALSAAEQKANHALLADLVAAGIQWTARLRKATATMIGNPTKPITAKVKPLNATEDEDSVSVTGDMVIRLTTQALNLCLLTGKVPAAVNTAAVAAKVMELQTAYCEYAAHRDAIQKPQAAIKAQVAATEAVDRKGNLAKDFISLRRK